MYGYGYLGEQRNIQGGLKVPVAAETVIHGGDVTHDVLAREDLIWNYFNTI